MEKQLIDDVHQSIPDKEVWYETKDPGFLWISRRSRVVNGWLSYQEVKNTKYAHSPVQPLNNYVANIGYEPSLVSIDGNTVTLRFHLYADMFLLKEGDDDLYHVDRTWIRQYYRTNYKMPERDDCFEETFKFYVPWFIDDQMEVEYLQSNIESPFIVEYKKDFWYKVPPQEDFLNPHFVYFKFRNIGQHMEDSELGIPRRGDPMFDMRATVSDIMVERIKEYYANN